MTFKGTINKTLYKNNKGFTLVELLIVIVIIAILAAISIVAYSGITNRAHKSAVQNDLRNAGQKLQIYALDNDGYPTSTNQLREVEITTSKDSYDVGGPGGTYSNFYYCASNDGEKYAIGARAKGSGASFVITSEGGIAPVSGAIHTGTTCSAAGIGSDHYALYGLRTNGTWMNWVK